MKKTSTAIVRFCSVVVVGLFGVFVYAAAPPFSFLVTGLLLYFLFRPRKPLDKYKTVDFFKSFLSAFVISAALLVFAFVTNLIRSAIDNDPCFNDWDVKCVDVSSFAEFLYDATLISAVLGGSLLLGAIGCAVICVSVYLFYKIKTSGQK